MADMGSHDMTAVILISAGAGGNQLISEILKSQKDTGIMLAAVSCDNCNDT